MWSEQKDELKWLIIAFIQDKRSPETFDAEWTQLLERIVATASFRPLTLGQAQKVASIFLKYGFCVYHAYGPNAALGTDLIHSFETLLPVPINSMAMSKLHRLARPSFIEKRLEGESLKQEDGKWVRWSGLTCLTTYGRFQGACRAAALARNQTPLEFEMLNLWTSAS